MLLGLLPLSGVAALWPFRRARARDGAREHVADTVEAIADVMFPGDGLPGARQLGLPAHVLAMPELAVPIARGVGWLDAEAARHGAADFLGLDATGRLAALDAAFASGDDGIQALVLALRFHVGMAYYTHPAVKSAFAYTGPPQPDGFADFAERPA